MNRADDLDRDQAVTVPCPLPPKGCGQPVGAPCVRATSRCSDGKPLTNAPAHTSRLQAAGVVHAPLSSRELAAPHERTPT